MGQIGIGSSGGSEAARILVSAIGHRRLGLGQFGTRGTQFLGRVLISIGLICPRHRLLGGRQLSGWRRQGGACGKSATENRGM